MTEHTSVVFLIYFAVSLYIYSHDVNVFAETMDEVLGSYFADEPVTEHQLTFDGVLDDFVALESLFDDAELFLTAPTA